MCRMLFPCSKLMSFVVLSPPLSPYYILFFKPNIGTYKKMQEMSSLTLQWEQLF